MPIFTQGEDYEETEVDEQEAVVEEEQEQPKAKKPKKSSGGGGAGSKVKLIACGVVGVTVVAIAVGAAITMASASKKKAVEESLAAEDDLKRALAEAFGQEPEVEEPAEEVEVSVSSSAYSDKELTALRKWGYTASEIEHSASQGLSAKELVEAARTQREEAQKEALAAVSDTAGEEYKNLLNKTWLGGEPIDLTVVDPEGAYTVSEETVNVDFEKVEPRGTQLYVKVYLDDGKTAFMQMRPQRYVTLPDSGNIVVTMKKFFLTETEYVIIAISEVSIG